MRLRRVLDTVRRAPEGLTLNEIAQKEFLSPQTVYQYVKKINIEAGAEILVTKNRKYIDALRLEKESSL